MTEHMKKKIIPIKFYVDQMTYESIIKYANKNTILIPDLMRRMIEEKFMDGTFESRIIKDQFENVMLKFDGDEFIGKDNMLKFEGLDLDEYKKDNEE